MTADEAAVENVLDQIQVCPAVAAFVLFVEQEILQHRPAVVGELDIHRWAEIKRLQRQPAETVRCPPERLQRAALALAPVDVGDAGEDVEHRPGEHLGERVGRRVRSKVGHSVLVAGAAQRRGMHNLLAKLLGKQRDGVIVVQGAVTGSPDAAPQGGIEDGGDDGGEVGHRLVKSGGFQAGEVVVEGANAV